MNKGAWLFVLIAGGYIGFELFTLRMLGHRMEVDAILEQMVTAEHATVRCDSVSTAQQRQYDKRLTSLKTRATRERSQAQPDDTAEQIAQWFGDEIAILQDRVDTLVVEQGCEGPDMVLMRKRFAIYAGKRRQ